MKKSFIISLCILLITCTSPTIFSQPAPVLDAGQLQLALKKLTVLGSVLYISAHPDDENTAVLAYCANEKLLRTGYLAITRGDGGQNLIGSEQADLMGVIRTQELLAARRIDGAEQFFTSANDFGYSKSPDETMQIWGKENILSDVVWIIRTYRPDVIITRFPKTGEGGHGHHTASAILAEEAFRAAADPKRFPEQLKHVKTWQATRILWNGWLPILQQRKADVTKMLKLDIGDYNPLLGKSYTELAAESRSMHKSQGFGSTGQRGETLNYFEHVAGDSAANDVFEKIDMSWSRVTRGAAVGKILEQALASFKPGNPSAIIPQLMKAYSMLNTINDDYLVPIKRKELLNVIRSCAGIWIEAIASDYSASPGNQTSIAATIINRSNATIQLSSIRFPFLPGEIISKETLKKGQPLKVDTTLTLPKDIPYTQPYWLRAPHEKGMFVVPDQMLIGTPENQPSLVVEFTISAEGQQVSFTAPVLYRWTDPVKGEQYRPFEITPAVALNLEEKVFVFPNINPKDVHVALKCNSPGVMGNVRLKLPAGWQATPAIIPFFLAKKNEETTVRFTVQPPSKNSVGLLTAEADTKDGVISQGMFTIDYPHIPMQTLFPPAHAKLVRLDIGKKVQSIGYIMGSGDDIPLYLAQLGYNVTILTDKDLDQTDFSTFDAVVAGVRAYNTRNRLQQAQKRLMEYVKTGGTYVVQYNTTRGFANRAPVVENFGPYPFKLSSDRVTVEEAPITFLSKDNSVLHEPNKITQEDFDGWVQERGLYFSNEWDPHYQTVLSCSDPNESARNGGLLFTRYGKGVFIYTGYSFFRQLPAGVPGAYRLFINLISAGKVSLAKSE